MGKDCGVGTQNMRMGMEPQRRDDEALRRQEQFKQIREAQTKAYEAEKERINEQYKEEGKSIDDLMEDYAKEDLYKEYLVHMAILTCDQATVEDFILPNGRRIFLRDKNPRRKQGELEVDENPVSANGLCYATVRDTLRGYNIPHFLCNCKQSQISREEMINIMKDKDCYKFGVCRHLMKLEKWWSNMPMEEGSYLAQIDTYPAGDGPILESAEREAKGITMTSVLFCKQGGIIYPKTSGQLVEEKQEILSELEKDILNRFYEELAFENWQDDKKRSAQEIWNKFYGEYGYDAEFVAGIIGNVYGEAAFGMLQSYNCDWSKYSSSLKGYMIITNIEQARIACLVAPGNYGIGAVQWSNKDRKNLLYQNYQLSQSKDGSLSTDQLIEAEIKTIYDEFNGSYSKICETYQDKVQNIDEIGDSIVFSTCIVFRDYEIPASYKDVDKANDYALAAGVDKRAEKAQNIKDVPSIIKRIIAAKVAYEEFME